MKEQAAEPIWNMSIEDLLMPAPDSAEHASSGPFVLNLRSASTPPQMPGAITGLEQQRLYRVSHVEHGRPRYRLRIGFFRERQEAEVALAQVRESYPSAFVACALDDDMRFAPDDLRAEWKARPRNHAAPAPETQEFDTGASAELQPPEMDPPSRQEPVVESRPAPAIESRPATPPSAPRRAQKVARQPKAPAKHASPAKSQAHGHAHTAQRQPTPAVTAAAAPGTPAPSAPATNGHTAPKFRWTLVKKPHKSATAGKPSAAKPAPTAKPTHAAKPSHSKPAHAAKPVHPAKPHAPRPVQAAKPAQPPKAMQTARIAPAPKPAPAAPAKPTMVSSPAPVTPEVTVAAAPKVIETTPPTPQVVSVAPTPVPTAPATPAPVAEVAQVVLRAETKSSAPAPMSSAALIAELGAPAEPPVASAEPAPSAEPTVDRASASDSSMVPAFLRRMLSRAEPAPAAAPPTAPTPVSTAASAESKKDPSPLPETVAEQSAVAITDTRAVSLASPAEAAAPVLALTRAIDANKDESAKGINVAAQTAASVDPLDSIATAVAGMVGDDDDTIEAEALKIENLPEPLQTEAAPEAPKIEATPVAPKAEPAPETPKVEAALAAPKADPAPETPKTQPAPETPKLEVALEPLKIGDVHDVQPLADISIPDLSADLEIEDATFEVQALVEQVVAQSTMETEIPPLHRMAEAVASAKVSEVPKVPEPAPPRATSALILAALEADFASQAAKPAPVSEASIESPRAVAKPEPAAAPATAPLLTLELAQDSDKPIAPQPATTGDTSKSTSALELSLEIERQIASLGLDDQPPAAGATGMIVESPLAKAAPIVADEPKFEERLVPVITLDEARSAPEAHVPVVALESAPRFEEKPIPVVKLEERPLPVAQPSMPPVIDKIVPAKPVEAAAPAAEPKVAEKPVFELTLEEALHASKQPLPTLTPDQPKAVAPAPAAPSTAAASKGAPPKARPPAANSAPAKAARPAKSAMPATASKRPVPSSPASAPAKPAPIAAKPAAPAAQPAAPAKLAPIFLPPRSAQSAPRVPTPPVAQAEPDAPELDSTMTLRVLTQDEINDKGGQKYFAIQLAASEQAINLAILPRLDIFEEYNLYSIVGTEDGKELHMLRMGFFSAEMHADAVAAYMKSFFDAPGVKRVSAAERERFHKPKAQEAEVGENTVTEQAVVNGSSGPHATNGARTPATPAKVNGVQFVQESRNGSTGRYKVPRGRQPSLGEQLRDEARQSKLGETGVQRAPSGSLWSRLFGR